jgi:hypothetical protein
VYVALDAAAANRRYTDTVSESPVIERILLVAGAQGTGKSTQLRAMFRDPRLGTDGCIPEQRNLPDAYELSPSRRLYLRLTSPHEARMSLEEFLQKISDKATSGRWCVASAVQVEASRQMPDLRSTVRAICQRFSPERVRVALLSPDREGSQLEDIGRHLADLRDAADATEVMCVDARTPDRNGLLLVDTFDFA